MGEEIGEDETGRKCELAGGGIGEAGRDGGGRREEILVLARFSIERNITIIGFPFNYLAFHIVDFRDDGAACAPNITDVQHACWNFRTGWLSFEMISQDHASQVQCGKTYSTNDPRQCNINKQ